MGSASTAELQQWLRGNNVPNPTWSHEGCRAQVDATLDATLPNWSKEELKEWLCLWGLPVSGQKVELWQRVADYLLGGSTYESSSSRSDVYSASTTELQHWLSANNLPVSESREECRVQVEATLEATLPMWNKDELREWLRQWGLPVSGRTADLMQRMTDYLVGCESASDEDVDLHVELHSWTVAELKSWLRAHGLPVSGRKADLVERVAANLQLEPLCEDEEYSEEEYSEEEHLGEGEASWLGDLVANMGNITITSGGASGVSKRRALIVACSYRGTSNELGGTLADADQVADLLTNVFQFQTNEITQLRDDLPRRQQQPTKANIFYALNWLTEKVEPGTSLFFYFAGHGGLREDPTGIEPSGFNQTICPVDCDEVGDILDTELHQKLVKRLTRGATLHALVDACHSGTVLNLPFNADTDNGNFKRWKNEYPDDSIHKWNAPGGNAFQFSASAWHETAKEYVRKTPRGTVKSNGAATYAFCRAIDRHRRAWGSASTMTYGDVLKAMHDELCQERRFKDQTPTLSSTVMLDCLDDSTCFTL